MNALRDSLGHMRLADNIADEVAAMATALGFRTFMLGYVNPALSVKPFWIDNMPARTWDTDAVVCRDPVTTQLIATKVSKTIAWDCSTYANAGAGDLWELGNSVGITSGVVHLACIDGKRRLLLSMDRDVPFDGTPDQAAEQACELVRLSDMLAGTVISLFDTQDLIENDLTKAELEALKWVFARGYTQAHIAERLNLSYSAADRLLHSATEKLGAGNFIQAAMIAAKYGVLGAI